MEGYGSTILVVDTDLDWKPLGYAVQDPEHSSQIRGFFFGSNLFFTHGTVCSNLHHILSLNLTKSHLLIYTFFIKKDLKSCYTPPPPFFIFLFNFTFFCPQVYIHQYFYLIYNKWSFFLQTVSTIVCEECAYSSQMYEQFLDLSLPGSSTKPFQFYMLCPVTFLDLCVY